MEKIFLWEEKAPCWDDSIAQERPYLKPFLLADGKAHGAMIICPGGAYAMKCSDYEGDEVAQKLNAMGFHAFVLEYRVAPYHFPVPLLDAQRAVRLVRAHAAEWNILKDKIGMIGFSAGGHLCALCGTHFDKGNPEAVDPVDRFSSRPDLIALCYGVLNIHMMRWDEIANNMTGKKDLGPLEERALSPEYAVSDDTPPCFLFHAADDSLVPAETSIDFAQKCIDHGVPTTLHVYPFGGHGIGLGNHSEAAGAETWSDLLGKFMRHLGF